MRASQGLAITFAEADVLDLAFPVAGISRNARYEGVSLTSQALPMLPQCVRWGQWDPPLPNDGRIRPARGPWRGGEIQPHLCA